jgi:hypothetical protein
MATIRGLRYDGSAKRIPGMCPHGTGSSGSDRMRTGQRMLIGRAGGVGGHSAAVALTAAELAMVSGGC